MKVYKVGGAVRDKLLGLPVDDVDWVVVGSTPEEMQERGFQPVGKEFPVFLHPESKQEYALARSERKTGRGYKGFTFNTAPGITLKQDLQRRDLTINAMAEDETGRIIDPFGGEQDLAKGILRHVSPAFVEDPLRVLRVARFAARFGFRVADETMTMMRKLVAAGEMAELQAERIWTELEKSLQSPYPESFVQVLRDCDALAAVFPEIDCLFGVPQPARYHPEIDTGVHTLMVLHVAGQLTADPVVRFAALTHDLGKGTTRATDWPSHPEHERRGVEILHQMCDRLRVPNRYRDLAALVARYHLHCHRILELSDKKLLQLFEALDVFRRPQRLDQFLLACEADARGRRGLEDKPYPQAKYLRDLYAEITSIDATPFAAEGLNGAGIGAAIRSARLAAIHTWRESQAHVIREGQ